MNPTPSDSKALSASEQQFILSSPEGLALLMAYEDMQHQHACAVLEPDEVEKWPTRRWQQCYERGRSIMAEDLDIWDNDLRRQFDFPESTGVAPSVPAEVGEVGVKCRRDGQPCSNYVECAANGCKRAQPTAQAQAADLFRGDTASLIDSIQALLDLDAAGSLKPHGIGGHARILLSAAAVRLAPSPEARETAEPIGFITEEALRLLRDPEWLAQRGTYANLWGTDGPPNRAIVPVFAAPVSQPEALPLKSMNWHPGPIKTEWGDGMLVADVELSPDQTLTMFIHKNALPLLKDKP
jgi:hypothetical protein